MALLTLSGVERSEKDKFIVKDLTFSQEICQKIAISGETGSGKSTLLKMIAGLIQPSGGQIRLHGERVLGPEEKLIPGHPKIVYLSQQYELRNNYWIHEILEYANKLTRQEADALYAVCRIQHLLNRRTDQLSGGEKQRIALARLLTTSPDLLLLDEPFSNLDAIHKNIIKSVVQDIGEKLRITCIMVSHDALDVLSWADNIFIMKDGQIVQQATPHQIYSQPVDAYCAGLMGSYSVVNSELADRLPLKLQDPKRTGKSILIRPEELTIMAPGMGDWAGIVHRISFYGAYFLIDVLIEKQAIVQVKVPKTEVAIGDEVSVTVISNAIRFI
jgi:ABC-type sugar transport system ATPase subunit